MLLGMQELAKMRRSALRRSAKHPPVVREVAVSLAKLYRGCTKSVAVPRMSLDPSGAAYEEVKARSARLPPPRCFCRAAC